MNYNTHPGADENVDELVAKEIESYKSRVYFQGKELEDCNVYPNRINLLIQLSTAVSTWLLLESNQQQQKDNAGLKS